MKLVRRLAALALALLLLPAPARAAYSDVPETSWAYESIERATNLNLIGGVGKGRFGLKRQITRAEYAAMLCRLMGGEMLAPEKGSFDDNQDPSAWYYGAVETAYAHGALLKLGARAGVTEPLRREELAAMTVRALGYAALAGVAQGDCPFDDVTTNRGYVALAYHMGLMDGARSGKFAPKTIATREQAAVVLLRVYDRLHAAVEQKTAAAAPDGAIRVASIDSGSGSVPMCPRAPLADVYAAALEAGAGGAVALNTAPYDATTGKTITRERLASLLADKSTKTYRSARYGSSYLTRGSSVVWYESEDDVAEKVALCRMLGVKTVYLL